jgi:hypothetical protein
VDGQRPVARGWGYGGRATVVASVTARPGQSSPGSAALGRRGRGAHPIHLAMAAKGRSQSTVFPLPKKRKNCAAFGGHLKRWCRIGFAARVTDSDLRGYNRVEPGWIADRISALVTAIEIARMLTRREPLIKGASKVLESFADGRRLVDKSGAQSRISGNLQLLN